MTRVIHFIVDSFPGTCGVSSSTNPRGRMACRPKSHFPPRLTKPMAPMACRHDDDVRASDQDRGGRAIQRHQDRHQGAILTRSLKPQALNPKHYTLNPKPNTLNPAPYTLHPTPYTLHP